MQTVCFILVSANSESWSGIQSDPTQYDQAVKYVGVRVKATEKFCLAAFYKH